MHAVFGRWTMDETRTEEQAQQLRDRIVPMVKAQPGFVAGYWTRDPQTGRTHTAIILDSEESADALKTLIDAGRQQAAQAGVTNDFLVITDVTAHAEA
jgi:hypothetical protein